MALIGSWGSITFIVARNQIKTFDGLTWESGVKYASHERHLKDPLPEFTGLNGDTINFEMTFAKPLGIDPITEIAKLLNAERAGEVNRLIIGAKAYGTGKWVITKTTKNLQRIDAAGRVILAKVSVGLLAYPTR
jgi:phage protein U